jgi:hypothetical protein
MMFHPRRVDGSVPNKTATTTMMTMMMTMARTTERRRAVVIEVTRATRNTVGAKVVAVVTSTKRNDGIPTTIRAALVVAERGTITGARTRIHPRLIPLLLPPPPLRTTIVIPKRRSPRVEKVVVIKNEAKKTTNEKRRRR